MDVTPLIAGMYLMQCHLFTAYVWTFLRVVYTIEIHSGYDLWVWRLIPFYGGAPMHDHHHNAFSGNYADCFVIWDKVFGTWLEPPGLKAPQSK